MLHAERIGHGYAVEKDAGVYDGVLQSQTHLEVLATFLCAVFLALGSRSCNC